MKRSGHAVLIGMMAMAILVWGGVQLAAEDYPQFSYDAGVGTGVTQDGTFFEVQAALNTHVNVWLTWRNSAFYRNAQEADDYFGLDTSMNAGHRISLGETASLRPEAGLGYRVTNELRHAPFASAGTTLALGDVTLGASARYVAYELVSDDESEFIYAITVSGRTRGRF